MVVLVSSSSFVTAREPVEFDAKVLKDRGIDPALAQYFRDSPRFTQGSRLVALEVNGQPKGRVRMTFSAHGELCLEPQWLKAAGIRPLSPVAKSQPDECVTVTEGFPDAIVQLYPGREQVELLVPTRTLALPERTAHDFDDGGVAGVFNYDLLVAGSELGGQRSTYRNLGSEVGLNAGNWILRSRQSYTALPGSTRFEHLYAYGMRTLEAYEASVQVGQLNLASALFAGESFTGVQILPETAFAQLRAAQNGARGHVEGVAYSPSRIEVRQNGVVIYTTMVPGGPFTLRALPLLSNQLDLEVSVHEQDGQIRRYQVPSVNLREGMVEGTGGFNFALGSVRRLGTDDRHAPSFATFSKDWDWNRVSRITGGLLAGTDYLSAGWGLQRQWGDLNLGVRQVFSDAGVEGVSGNQVQMTLNASISPTLSTSLIAVHQSGGFRTLSDTGWNQERGEPGSRSRNHLQGSLNLSTEHWGAFGATWSRYLSEGAPPQSRTGLSWSRTLPQRISLSVSLERDVGGQSRESRGTSAYLTLGVPLGGQARLRSYLRTDEQSGTRKGLAVSDVLSENLAYTVRAEYPDAAPANYAARINALPYYTSLDLGVGQRSGATDYDVGLRGGAAFHRDGVTLSPYPLRDTIGVLKAGDRAGVKLNTPQGPVWTDGTGHAIAATLPAYSTARLEVDPLSLPRNVEVLDGLQEVTMGRGSVKHLDFSIVTVRRLLLRAMTVDRQWLTQGLTVEDEQGRYLTTVLESGTIFLPDVKSDQTLLVQLPDTTRCILQFALSDAPEDSAQIERVDAMCTPVELS
ncbi:pilus assembly protein PapC [Pseudomonas sp. MPR-ANC1]|nr:pilus assembly protein PapC [Pseudomonas sp. MPR-ANC1]